MKLGGRNPIFERLRVNPQSIKKIHLQHGFSDGGFVRKRAKKYGIPIVAIPSTKMVKIARGKNTQGILADVDEFEYIPYHQLIDQAVNKRRTLIFLDGVTDPQNLGAIVRSLGSLGRFSLVLPTHDSVSVTEAVLRVASGGDNHVPVAQVSNINKALKEAKDHDFTIIGTMTKEGESLYDVDLPPRLGIVIGGEQKGIRPVILKNLDIQVTIPMLVDTMSLNVASATTIICYEISKQKHKRKTG